MAKIPLDAREILSHLNQLGYRNITPEQLKEFQKDLRKLIKFDTRSGSVGTTVAVTRAAQPMDTFQRLHTLSTISYNAKVARKPHSKQPSTANSIRDTEPEIEPQRSEMVTPVDEPDGKENQQMKVKAKKSHREKESNAKKMWIRPRSTSANSFRKNDPVSLYHNYQKEWARFKNRLPGENDHSELRWQIRTKLLTEK